MLPVTLCVVVGSLQSTTDNPAERAAGLNFFQRNPGTLILDQAMVGPLKAMADENQVAVAAKPSQTSVRFEYHPPWSNPRPGLHAHPHFLDWPVSP